MKSIASKRLPRISHALLATLIVGTHPLIAQTSPAPGETQPQAAAPTDQTSEKPASDKETTDPSIETVPPTVPAAAPKSQSSKLTQDNKPEVHEVTGSRIKRSQNETSSARSTITREEIERSGVSNLGELIRNSSAQTLGNFSGTSGYVRAGAQTANLFGLGAGRTLVLIDGERLPRDASLGGTNLSNIPIAMVERIEYLTGSRSAIYGSDAVAGVMNVITKKNFSGTVVSSNVRVPKHPGGNKFGVDVTTGVSPSDTSNIIVSGGYERESKLLSKNRDFGGGQGKFANSSSYVPAGQFTYRVRTPGQPVGLWTPSANCERQSDLMGPDPAQVNTGTFCVGNTRDASDSEFLGASERGFFSTRGEVELNDALTLRSFLSYAQNRTRGNSGNYFRGTDYLTSRGQTISADLFNGLNTGAPAVPTGSTVELSAVDYGAPDRITLNKDQAYGGLVGLDAKLGSEWTGSATLSHYTTESRRRVENVIDRQSYARLMHGYQIGADGQLARDANGALLPRTDPQYIIIDPNRNQALLGQMVDTMKSSERNTITGVTVNAGRELIDLPGGKLAFNIGLDSRIETYEQIPDPQDVLFFNNSPRFTGTEAVAGKGDRSVNSIYAEILAPVLESVDIDAAVRFDNYSDFGDSTNYTLGGNWEVLSSLSLRTSFGTSYRAPELSYIHKSGGGGYVYIRDENWCAYQASVGSPCVENQTHQIFADSPGNENLNPEVGRTYTIGFTYEPITDLYFKADYAGFYIKDEFAVRPTQDIVDDYFAGRGIGDNRVNLDPANGYITSINRPYTNIGWSSQYLIKGEAGYKFKVGDVQFDYGTDGTRVLSYKSLRADNTVKQYNGLETSPRWRWNNSFTTSLKPVAWTISTMTIAKQEPDPENMDIYTEYYYNDQVDEFTQYNTSVKYDYLDSGSIVIGVNNIFDKLGGLYRTGNYTGANSTNSYLYGSSYYGLSYFASVTQRF